MCGGDSCDTQPSPEAGLISEPQLNDRPDTVGTDRRTHADKKQKAAAHVHCHHAWIYQVVQDLNKDEGLPGFV